MRTTSHTVGFLVSVPAVLLLVLSSPASSAYADELITAPLGAFVGDCEYHCRSCGSDKHDIVVHHSQNNHESSHLENCTTGSCTSHDCNESLASVLQHLWTEIQQSDGAQLQAILERHAEIAEYNETRAAVQFRCAAGSIVASLPLTDRQAASLE